MNDIKRNQIEELLYAMQQKNLVYNYNFLYFSNKKANDILINYGHPDGWVFTSEDGCGIIGLNTSANSCLIRTGNEKVKLSQALHEFPRWRENLTGKKITAKAHIHLASNSVITFSLSDGVKTKTSLVKGTGDIEPEVQIDVSKDATQLQLSIESSTTNVVINISKVYANIGNIALEGLPCIINGVIGECKQYLFIETPPAGDLLLGKVQEELAPDYSRLNSVLNKRYGKANNGMSLLPDIHKYVSHKKNMNERYTIKWA